MTTATPVSPRARKSLLTLATCALLGAAAFYLWKDHRDHTLSVLPYLFLLACPLMHLFMHRRHGRSHGSHHDHAPRS